MKKIFKLMVIVFCLFFGISRTNAQINNLEKISKENTESQTVLKSNETEVRRIPRKKVESSPEKGVAETKEKKNDENSSLTDKKFSNDSQLEITELNKNIQALSNDECSNALPIDVVNCSLAFYYSFTTTGATASSGIPAPGCASYSGGDVWFKVVVPASGHIIFDTYEYDILDGGMAIYSGDCTSLTLIECDDDDGVGLMPYIDRSGLTPGSTIYIRFWEYGNNVAGYFYLSIYEPVSSTSINLNGNMGTVSGCCVELYDNGGTLDYGNNQNSTITFQTTAGNRVRMSIWDFATENGWDYLWIYDGPNTSSPLMFKWTGIPAYIPDAVSSGQYLTVKFTSDGSGKDVGFAAYIFCEEIPPAPGLCSGNSPASDNCSNSTHICDPNQYCGNTSSYYTPDLPGNMCNGCGLFGGSIENNSWISFTAAATIATLQFNVTNCTDALGIQFGIYSGSSCNSFTLLSNVTNTTNAQIGSQQISASGLTVGNTYYVMVDGFAGDVCDYSITVIDGIMTGTVSGDQTVCYGSTGVTYTMNAIATGYNWSVPTGATITAGSGTNTITVNWGTASSGDVVCTASAGTCDGASSTLAVNITVPATASISYTGTPFCKSSTSQTVTLTGTGTYTGGTYTASSSNLSINGTTGTINPSASLAGTYTVTYTLPAVGGCSTIIATTSVTVKPALTATATASNVNCNGDATGGVSLTPGGGTPSYTYNWSNSTISQNLSNVVAGDYYVTVTDDNSCTVTTSATVTQPASALTATITGNNPSCNGSANGSVSASASGGTSAYSYLWDDPAFQTTSTASNLLAGTYSVTITDLNGCKYYDSQVLNQPSAITITEASNNDATCGNADGSASISVSGGTSPYTYLWTDGETSNSISGKLAGSYNVTVTDANSCSNILAVVIGNASAPVANLDSQTNILCNGNNTGSATITYSGGTSPYTIIWSSGGNSTTESNLIAGNYSVTVEDANNCQATVNVTITQPNPLNAPVTSQTNVNCFGENNGSATISVSGGVTPYSYSWSAGGSTTATNGSLTAGNYDVTVTDANSCTKFTSVTITEPSQLLSSLSSQTDVNCNGEYNGEVTVTVSGGTSPYNYAWSSGGTGLNETGLNAGTYTFTATDNHGCTTNLSIDITEPQALAASVASSSNLTCNSSADGDVTINVTGGVTPYTILWSNGNTGLSDSNLSAGLYTFTVTDAHSCTDSASVTLTEPLILNAVISSYSDVNCNGGNDGSATVIVSGGTTPYAYNWSSGGNGATENNLSFGTYTVTVTDVNNCENIVTVDINQPATLTSSIVINDSINCNGFNNGILSVNYSGGTPPYNIIWSSGGTTDIESNLVAGNYDVSITDANLCTTSASISLPEPEVLNASIIGTDVSCNGGNDGSADLTVTGGTSPYTFEWSTLETIEDISGLNAANFVVTVTDYYGCIVNTNVNINEPSVLALTPSSTQSSCGNTDATASVTPSGGTTPYTYFWSNSQTTQSISSLPSGSYSVTVTDNNGCKDSLTISISDMGAPVAVATVQSNVSCFGYNDGSATVNVTSGNSPFTYLWSDASAQTDSIAVSLVADTYSVTVFDVNNCKTIETITITQPLELISSYIKSDASCNTFNDGSINLTVAGGITPYSFIWDDILNSNTEDLSGLTADNYSVTITDANGCISNSTITINEPDQIIGSIAVTNVICNSGKNGALDLTVTGGTSPYTFLWNDSGNSTIEDLVGLLAGNYSVTITDANNCQTIETTTITEPSAIVSNISGTDIICYAGTNGAADLTVSGGTTPYTFSWSNSATTEDISNLSFGNYSVNIFDNNLCSATATITINQPTELIITFSNVVDAICSGNGGSATADVTGGVSAYTYVWDFYTGNQTTQTASGLTSGTYQLTVTDNNLCTATNSVTINSLAGGTAIITSSTNNNCFGDKFGSATASLTIGTSPYTYFWSNSNTTATANNLTAGTYSVTVTDANNCVSSTSVTISEPTDIELTTTQTPTSCYGGSGGTATVSATGGTFPYSYLWNDANNQTNVTATNLTATGYTVTVTDAQGCTKSENITVLSPEMINVTAFPTNVKCKGFNNGGITLTVNGGTSPYTYNWSNGSNSVTIINLATGVYSATVTDANGCSDTKEVTITEPASDLQFNVTTVEADCYNGDNGEATVNVVSGTSPYTYIWSANNQTSQTATGLIPNNYYTVTVTDFNSCFSVGIVNIGSPSQIERVDSLTTINNTSCMGSIDGSIFIKYTGGTSPYSYYWNNGKTDDKIYDLSMGTYLITITDFNNCELVDTFEVGTNPTNCLDIPTAFTPNADSYNDTWEIKYLYLYPNASIKVFNRWGQLVYDCKDGCKPWDGTHNGKPLAFGSFTYIIDLNDGTDPINGVVTLIK